MKKEELDKEFDRVRDEQTAIDRGDIATFFVMTKSGGFNRRDDGPCHAQLRAPVGKAYRACTFVSNRRRDYVGDEKALKFLDYLINRSPYAMAFITKDANEALERGMELNVDAPYEVFGAAAIMTRMLWENYSQLEMWLKLLKEGVSEDMALVGAHIASDGGRLYYYDALGNAHKAMYGSNVSKENIENLLQRIPRDARSFKDVGGYGSPSSTFGHNGGGRKCFVEAFRKTLDKKDDGWGGFYYASKDLKNFAKFLNEEERRILRPNDMAIKVMVIPEAVGKKKKQVARKKDLLLDFRVIKLVTEANGFTKEEVRRIRKEIRVAYGLARFKDRERRKAKYSSLISLFHWNGTEQGHQYWSLMHSKLARIERDLEVAA